MYKSTISNTVELYEKYNNIENNTTDFYTSYPYLYHYTDSCGLLGIIRNSSEEKGKLHLWFSRSDCLNDPSEGSHIMSLYKKVCNNLAKDGKIDKSFYDLVSELELSKNALFSYPLPEENKNTHSSMLDCADCKAFVCSFSLAEDSLDLWRYYAKGNDGYCLKFFPYIFKTKKDYSFSKYDENDIFSNVQGFSVIYDDKEKEKIITELLMDTYNLYLNRCNLGWEDERFTNFLENILKKYQFRFKHGCYSSEKEYRYVFYRPIKKPNDLKNELPKINYRAKNGLIIPYLDIEIEKDAHYFREIMISPFNKNERSKYTLTDYIKHCGFSGIHVSESQLPVR